jgi:fibronectin-binding autotransporter adhesin
MKSCIAARLPHVFTRCACQAAAVVAFALAIARPGATCAADYALTFANSTQYVSTPAKVATANFTFEAWVRVTSYAAQNWVFTQYVGGNAGRMVGFIENTNACFFLGGKYIRNTAAVPLNTWTHFAVTRSGSTGSVYVNGALYATDTIPTATLSSTGITIGGHPSTGWSFHGQIADVRAWNFARSQPQIASSMYTRMSGMESGLVGYWPVNDGTGTSVNERVAGAHGTLAGTPLPAWFYSADLPVFGMVNGTWNSTSGGNWSAVANWLDGTLPNGDGHLAFFTNQTAAALAVTNDLSPLLLGGMVLSNASGCVFSGSTITFTNAASPAYVSALGGTHVFDLPIVFGSGGLAAGASAPAAINFSNVLSGSGALAVNPEPSGGGCVTLSGANTYTGPTSLGCGMLAVNALADGGAASPIGASSASAENLLLGPGTFYYSGPATATDRGYTLAAGSSPVRAAVLRLDNDLTFSGQCLASSGAFLKTGPGTLRYTYAGGTQTLAVAQGNGDALLNIGANGDSPTTGFHAYTISNGKVIMGAEGQANLISNGRLTVGHYTTAAADAETAGELQIDGGVLICNDTMGIGRGNGTTVTAPGGLSSRMTVNGGAVTCAILSLGFVGGAPAATFNARPIVDINAGLLEATGEIRVGESQGSVATVNLRGGTLRCPNSRIVIGGSAGGTGNPCGTGILNLSGTGVLDIAQNVVLALNAGGSTGVVNLMGGTLIARNIAKGSGNSGVLVFNGGCFQPRTAGYTLSGLTAAYVSTNGAVIDTTLADYAIGQDLLHAPDAPVADGGLVKLGTNTLTLSSYASTYTGPTVVSNGTLLIAGGLPADNALVVAAGGEALIGGSATQTVADASLALDAGATLGFVFALDGSTNDRLTVASSPSFAPGSRIALYPLNTRLPFTRNGTYTLLAYSGADPAVANLSCANAVYGKSYTFAAAAGNLTVTIGNDTSAASVWNVNAGGDWSDAGKWSVEPSGEAGSQVRFDSAITAPATVTTAGETVGEIYLNNAAAYTLGGTGLTLDNNTEPALVNVESGSHTITAPLTLSGDTTLNLSASTLLTLGAATGASASLSAQGNGTLALAGELSVQALSLNVPELGVSNTLTLTPPVVLQRSVTVRPALSTTATVSGVISGTANLTKDGSSTLALSADNTYNGRTVVAAGTLTAGTLADGGVSSSIGASPSAAVNWTFGPATFHYAGPSTTIDRGYHLAAGYNPVLAAVMRLDNDLTIGGQCTIWHGAFLKTGPGTLRYTYPGAQTLADVEKGDGLLNIGANGDSPTTGFFGYSISNGKVIMGVPGQTNTINCRINIGLYTTTAAGAETAGELELADGVLNCNTTLGVGRGNGTTVTAPGGISSRFTVNGGVANIYLIGIGFAGAVSTSTFNARPVIDINAGAVNVTTDTRIGDSKGSVATLNVRGGTLRCFGHNAYAGLTLGGAQNDSGTGTLNLMGTGVVDIAHNVMLGAGARTPGNGTLNLEGGTLIASNIVRGAGTGYVRFNGGTFMPRSSNSTMTGLTAATVSTNGAVIDTTLADGYTVAQNLLHDPELAAADGGLVKLGTNTLSLTGTGNTFNGLVDVRTGLLRARLGGTNDLSVAASAFFDALGDRCTVGDLTGSGTLTNGIIAVTGALEAGTNNAPAGARMTVQNLSLVKGSTFVCTWSTDGVGKITNDFVTVTGTLAPEGAGFIDLGRTEADPIPMPFTTTIMSYGSLSGSFAGWKAINTGVPAGKALATVVTAANGFVILEVRYGGTLIMLR